MKKNKFEIGNFLVWSTIICFWMILLMGALTNTYDTSTPAGTDNPRDADDRMREIKAAIQERMNDHNGEADEGDHYWDLTGTEVSDTDTGEHRKITLREMSGNPDALTSYATITNKGFLFTKDDSGDTELYYEDDSSNVIQLTADGYILGDSMKADTIDGTVMQLDNNQWLTAENAAADGTVNLIKADAADVSVLADGAQIEAATESGDGDRTIADKAYVDAVETAKADIISTCTNNDSESNALAAGNVYQAELDGILIVRTTYTGAHAVEITIEAGTSNPPGNTRAYEKWDNVTVACTITVPIKKDWYVKVSDTNSDIAEIEWTAFGSGDLVKQ